MTLYAPSDSPFFVVSRTMRPSKRATSFLRGSATTIKTESVQKNEEIEINYLKTEEIRHPEINILSYANSPPLPITTNEATPREPEVASSTKLSSKIIAYLSGKLNSVVPVVHNLDATDIQDYEQLAALSAGGVLDTGMEEALQARFGMDLESSEVVESEENQDNEEAVVVVDTNDLL